MNKPDDKSKGEEIFFKGRVQLVLKHPFYASMLLRRPVIIDDNLSFNAPMGVNGVSLFYSPDRIKDMPVDEVVQIFCHEVGHIMGNHPAGVVGKNEFIYMMACEYAVNCTMKVMGEKIGSTWMYDEKYNNLDHIKIYNLLMKDPKMQKLAKQYDKLKKTLRAGDLIPGSDIRIPRDIVMKNPRIRTKADSYIEENRLKRELASAAMSAKMAGNLPAGLERFIQGFLEPKVDWRDVLSRFLSEKLKSDFSWQQPNRRFLPQEIYLPSLSEEVTGSIAWVVDSSGSIGETELKIMHSELFNVLATIGTLKVTFLSCDAAVHGEPVEVRYNDPPPKVHGGGGTNYRPAFEKIKSLQDNFAAIVYLTDGYCNSFPDKEPQAPTLWVLTPEHAKDFKPPFGEVIMMEKENE